MLAEDKRKAVLKSKMDKLHVRMHLIRLANNEDVDVYSEVLAYIKLTQKYEVYRQEFQFLLKIKQLSLWENLI